MQSDPQRYHRPTVGPEGCRGGAMGSNGATHWVERFLDDLGVIRSANTVRAYRQDLVRWVAFCASRGVGPLRGDPERCGGVHRPRAAAADPAAGCGVSRRSASGTTSWRWSLSGRAWLAIRCPPGRPSGRRRPRPPPPGPTLGYDRAQPQVLDEAAIARFEAHLTATRYRDRAIVALLKDGGFRIIQSARSRGVGPASRGHRPSRSGWASCI